MTRGRKPKNPAGFGKQFEELKITKPTPYDNMPCGNPYIEGKEIEEDEQAIHAEKSKHNEIGGGITIFGDRETTEKVVAKLETDELIAKIKQTLVAVCRFCSSDVEIYNHVTKRTFNGGNASVEITYGTSESTKNFKHFKIKYRESDTVNFAELVEALKEWSKDESRLFVYYADFRFKRSAGIGERVQGKRRQGGKMDFGIF